MTPEEIARKALIATEETMRVHGFVSTAHIDYGIAHVADAIRAAVVEEREECAKVAAGMEQEFSTSPDSIAFCIRARGEKPS